MEDVRELLRQAAERRGLALKASREGPRSLRPPKTTLAVALEAKGYEPWLQTLGPRSFTRPFAPFHHEFWGGWYWPVRQKLLAGETLTPEEMTMLVMWFRGGGKSTHVEWACVGEGALVGEGFVGYVSDTEALARGHIQSIRNLLLSPEVARYYPGLSNPQVDRRGTQIAWRQDHLFTASGWGIIPIGLEEGVRGGRLHDLRFSMFIFDDVDSRKDSPAAVEKKLKIIAHEILPAGTPETLNLFPQNLVHEDSALNQIYTRRSDILSERKESGPVKAFEELELALDERHPGKFVIRRASPTWPGIDMAAARKFLADSGRAAFMAEYQHEFDVDKSAHVLSHWDDAVHVITWSEFEAVYGTREIPARWGKRGFNDWARTKTARHANVAGFLTVSAQNTSLPGFVFLYNCMSFEAGTEADDVARRILEAITPGAVVGGVFRTWEDIIKAALLRESLEHYVAEATRLFEARRQVLSRVIPELVRPLLSAAGLYSFRGSHEQNNGALKVYRQIYGLPFTGVNPGAEGGLELLNHLTRVEPARPHPFRPDRMGYTRFFLVVNDNETGQLPARSEALHDGLLARYQLRRWRHQPPHLNASGEVERGPMKMDDDFGNGLQMVVHDGLPEAAPLTPAESDEERLVPELRWDYIQKIEDKVLRDHAVNNRQIQLGAMRAQREGLDMSRRVPVPRVRFSTGVRRQRFDEWFNPVE